ncbi:MAG: CocE/NonD family hydrolase, partial [Candidatus Binataceae bacterium]
WLKHPGYDDYWRALSIEENHAKINVPALNIGGWYDIFQGGTIRNYLGMKSRGATDAARAGQRLMIGPWNHAVPFANLVGAVDFGYQTGAVSADIDGQQLRFFDRHLKGKDVSQASNVRLFVMGINQWRDESEWPIPGTGMRRYFLHSRGRANSASGDGALSTDAPGSEPPDSFLYNPLDPAPTAGGGLCCYPAALSGGAFDQTAVEARSDVLIYSTEPLAEDLEVIGPITLTLYASSSAPDTDFTAKLVDLGPCGLAKNLTDGIIRARYRESQSEAKLLTPGKIAEFKIDLWSTANVFKAGHRIRLEVSSSNYPRFDPNPNTGHDLFADAEVQPAMQTVMHDRGFASHLTLPIVPSRR